MDSNGIISTSLQNKALPISKNGPSAGLLKMFSITITVFVLLLRIILAFFEAFVKLLLAEKEKPVKGEIVLVTGTGHGIGRELALVYAAAGAVVVGWDINEENNQETFKIIASLGYRKGYPYTCDITNREAVLELAKKVENDVGEVSVLINNAGIMPCHPFLDHSPEEIRKMFDVNVIAHHWTLEAFLPTMLRRNHGHIVGISSCVGLVGLPNVTPYSSTKYAVRGLMDSLRLELRTIPKCEIKLTTIYPFIVDTGLAKYPYVRFGSLFPILKPEQVAKCVIECQRKNVWEATVPRHLWKGFCLAKLLPVEVPMLLNGFLDMGVNPH